MPALATIVAAGIVALSGGTRSLADVAYNNFGPGDSYSGNGWILHGPQTPTPWTQGYQFVAQASGPVTEIVVPMQHLDGGDNSYSFEIYSNASGQPGTSLGVVGQTAGFLNNSPPLPPPIYMTSGGSVVLTSGTTYWIVGFAAGTSQGTWHQNDQGQVGLRAFMAGGATTWTTGIIDLPAFRIEVAGSGSCYADCDGIGGLTANDFQCFLNAYVAGQSSADCDGVGGLTANDFQCFLNAYVAGCS
jgi:hypothetical protein